MPLSKTISTQNTSHTMLSKSELKDFKRGEFHHLYHKFGAHVKTVKGQKGVLFAVWAPKASSVAVVGDFNDWKASRNRLTPLDGGIWEGFVPGAEHGDLYKYCIKSKKKKIDELKTDPFARKFEVAPKNAAIVWQSKYQWNDEKWLNKRPKKSYTNKPLSVYEVHLGSWRKSKPNELYPKYRDITEPLIAYVKKVGFNAIELMPLMEHPFYGSWGYQSLGYFAPTSRYGDPEDLMYLIDQCHQNDIAVILDWVPSHFPCDQHGLAEFDGTRLFEEDGVHPEWNSSIFNVGQVQVGAFVISSALYWLEHFHIDGLRVDAVASMLYLDYAREPGKWDPNFFGGKENIESVAFLRKLNDIVHKEHPGVTMFAEESTAWPNVTRDVSEGGLNFDIKWNMGWMNDTLKYFSQPHKLRKKEINGLTFSLFYAFHENYILSLSHDEVVYCKNSLLNKMPGRKSQKFSNLRCLFGLMFAHPGKKLLFMGGEFAQIKEWNHDAQLQWELLEKKEHKSVQAWVSDLNRLYQRHKALHELDYSSDGFTWLDIGSNQKGIIAFMRNGIKSKEKIIVICNFTNKVHRRYKLNVPNIKDWQILTSSDYKQYGGKDADAKLRQKDNFLTLNLPALSTIFLK